MPSRNRILPVFAVFFLAVAAFSQNLSNFFVSDDFLLLAKARDFRLSQLLGPYLDIPVGNFFRPLSTVYFYVLSNLAGFEPFYYHAMSILLHGFNVVVFYLLLVQFQSVTRVQLFPFLSSAIVAVHPRAFEAVITVYSFPDLLVVAFGLLTTISFFLFKKNKANYHHFLSVIAFMCALCSKENGVIALIVVVVLNELLNNTQTPSQVMRSRVYHMQPFILVTLVYLLFRFYSVGTIGIGSSEYARYDFVHISTFVVKAFVGFLIPQSLVTDTISAGVALGLMFVLITTWMLTKKLTNLISYAKTPEALLAFLLLCFAVICLLPASFYSFSFRTGQENRFLYFSLFPLSMLFPVALFAVTKSKRVLGASGFLTLCGFFVFDQIESRPWQAAAGLSRSFLESFVKIVDRIPQDRDIAVLDEMMYLHGRAVGVSSEALSMSRILLFGEKSPLPNRIHIVTRTAVAAEEQEFAVRWRVQGDTLFGKLLSGTDLFLGPVQVIGERTFLNSADDLKVEALEVNHEEKRRSVMIYPFSPLRQRAILTSGKGVFAILNLQNH